MNIAKIVEDTIVDGEGWRTSVYCQGCAHKCPECHNKSTWKFGVGIEMSVDEVFDRLKDSDNDITFTGGDPMYQAKEFAELAKKLHSIGKNIWCYTGFEFEQCYANTDMHELLNNIDVLVDGPFIDAKKSDELLFRGSSNQRIIDVQKSLKAGGITVLYDVKV